MTKENSDILRRLLIQHKELGISEQIDYEKFYLYSIITHSTAIEGSTMTEVEAQLLFDEGITSNKRTIIEQNMNLDLKVAYEYGREWIKRHKDITVGWLITLASKVMARTGAEYKSLGGDFSAAKGELRKLNVTAGAGGSSYMSYLKVPMKLEAFCQELNRRRKALDKTDIIAIYELSFWAHYELVTIHPWADGNGRTSRLLMNLLQMEYDVLPTKVLKEDKAEYIQSLIDSRDEDDIEIFINCMTSLHCKHLNDDIERFIHSVAHEEIRKEDLLKEITDKMLLSGKTKDKLPITDAFIGKITDIYIFISKHPHSSSEDIATYTGKSRESAKKYLQALTSIGMIVAEGGNRNRTYCIKLDT